MSEETIERLQRMADRAIHLPGEPPFVMSLDDGIALHEAIAALSTEPCEDAISRRKAIECVTYGAKPTTVRGRIAALPSVTPKQRAGHWIIISPTDMYCSECNEIEHLDTSRRFCAYCGTRMSENPTGLESEEQA